MASTTDGIGRRLSKVIKNESKAEQATLDVAVKELEGLQKLQKVSIKVNALPNPDVLYVMIMMDSDFVLGRSFFRRRLYPAPATPTR